MKAVHLFLLILLFLLNPSVQAQTPVPGRIIVQLQPKADIELVLRQLNAKRATQTTVQHLQTIGKQHNIHLLGFHLAKAGGDDIFYQLQQMPAVVAIQYDYTVETRQTPNDPEYERQWGLNRIDVQSVWDYTTGGKTAQGDEIVVAILDFGFDVNHEDLVQNIWRNSKEIPDDNIDNDNNGYIDDIWGWNFLNNTNEHTKDSHGTSVAGIIGASGNNNIGVTGINWNIKIMPFTVQDVSDIIAAYEYIIDQRKRYNESNGSDGAFVVATNASLGIAELFCSESPVWGGMYDLLGEVGILTGAATVNQNVDVDKLGDMPTTCTSDFLIASLNITQEDKIASNSGYGMVSIDLAAPGDGSYSTKIGGRYGSFGSNSAAAPHLTGAIALLYSLPCEALTANALTQPREMALVMRQAILDGVEPVVDLQGKTVTSGRLNIFRSLEQIQSYCETSTGKLDIIKVYPNPANLDITVEYESPDYELYQIFVYNALGQLVHHDLISPPRFAGKKHTIDVSSCIPGIYFLTLMREGTRVQTKFVVH